MSGALLLAVGNPARGDDGVGAAVAEAAASDRRFAGVTVRGLLQLTPELAAEVAEASVVVVVDARASGPPGLVQWSAVAPGFEPPVFSHHLSPPALVALTMSVYGQAPPVFALGVGAASFEAGAPLSEPVAAAVCRAVGIAAGLVGSAAAGLLRERSRPGTGRGSSTARPPSPATAP